jgi:telomerase protein component 1
MVKIWKTVRVFISSTFRDMHAERDYLSRVVFPELRERCAGRHLHLVDMDLRWGITDCQSFINIKINLSQREYHDDKTMQKLWTTVRGRS